MRTAKEALREIRNRLVYLYGKIDGTFDPPALKEVCEIADEGLADKDASVCNAAAMREALLQVALSCSACPRHNCKGCTRPFASFMPTVRKALSTPPRNCDKYRDYESLCRAWVNAVRVEGITFGKWLFAPATEWKGEGDGK